MPAHRMLHNSSSCSLAFMFIASNCLHCWASEASPTLGCSIEILRDIYIYVGMSVECQITVWAELCGPNTCLLKAKFWAVKPVTPVLLGERSEPHTGVFNRDFG